MASKKNFYAIAKGNRPGIYDNWPQAHNQVKGFPGALYKGFATRQEAEAWLENPHYSFTPKAPKPSPSTADETSPPTDSVLIYTDGGARYNPGPGGYGVVQILNGERKEMSGGFRLTTNNRMELTACIVALRDLEHRDKPVTLYTDSSYVVNGITKGWAKSWRKRGWIKSDKKPALNADLWAELLDLTQDIDITFKWVKGHAGNPLNERCDELAVAASREKNLPVDEGYSG